MKTSFTTLLLLAAIQSTYADSSVVGQHFLSDNVQHHFQNKNYAVKVDSKGNIVQAFNLNDSVLDGTPSQILPPDAVFYDKPVSEQTSYKGQDAINFLSTDNELTMDKVAMNHQMSKDELKKHLLHDDNLMVTATGDLVFTEYGNFLEGTATSDANLTPNFKPKDLNNTFKLHSKPGASKTLYLDFDGYQTANGSMWGIIKAGNFSSDSDRITFSDAEKAAIIEVFQRVAEDYIPFDVDVTTEAPDMNKIYRTSTSDNEYGAHVVISTDNAVPACGSGCGGISAVGITHRVNIQAAYPSWVFSSRLSNSPKNIAEAASHEAGHALGLFHDGVGTTAYYQGHGTGETSWAPIMGVGYSKNLSQWSKGEYYMANNTEDDVAKVAANGYNLRSDDVGDTANTSNNIPLVNTYTTYGIISTPTDKDVFSVAVQSGTLSLNLMTPVGTNLDSKLTVLDQNFKVITSNNPVDKTSSSISIPVSAGTYYIQVENTSIPKSTGVEGYSTYGSLGQYQLTTEFKGSTVTNNPTTNSNPNPLPPIVNANVPTSVNAGSTVNLISSSTPGTGSISNVTWNFSDDNTTTFGQSTTHKFNKIGPYTVTISVKNNYGITATKTFNVNVTASLTNTVKIGALTNTIANDGQKKWIRSTITTTDGNNKALPYTNVIVTLKSSLTGTATYNMTTDYYGRVTFDCPRIFKTIQNTMNMEVTQVAKAGFNYNPNLNQASKYSINY